MNVPVGCSNLDVAVDDEPTQVDEGACCTSQVWVRNFVLGVGFLTTVGIIVLVVVAQRSAATYNGACNACIHDKHSVWNTSSNACESSMSSCMTVINQSRAQDCLDDEMFCSAPQCQSSQVKRGVVSTPYWLNVVGVCIGTGLSIVVNYLLYSCRREAALSPESQAAADALVTTSQTCLPSAARTPNDAIIFIFGQTNVVLFLAMYSISIANLIFSVVSVHQSSTSAFTTPWERYDAVCLMWINSGAVAVGGLGYCMLASAVAVVLALDVRDETCLLVSLPLLQLLPSDKRSSSSMSYWFIVFAHMFLVPLPLFPMFATHIVPGWLIFFPTSMPMIAVQLLLAGVAALLFIIDKHFSEKFLRVWKRFPIFFLLVTRVYGSVAALVLCQTMCSYASMFYRGAPWVDVIFDEYRDRNTVCYFSAFASGRPPTAAALNLVSFIMS